MKLNRSLLGTPNFVKLVQIAGDRQKALGMLAEIFILAKDYYLPNRYAIPQAELMEAELPIEKLVKLKFLEKEVEGYYMTESEIVFDYYFSNKEQRRKAGKASAESEKHHALRGPDGRFISKEVLAKMSQAEIAELKRQQASRAKLKKKAKIVKNSKNKRKIVKKREVFWAWIYTDSTKKTSFTRHFSQLSAEKHYGDLSRHYKGSASSDYELAIHSDKSLKDMTLNKDVEVDWGRRIVYLECEKAPWEFEKNRKTRKAKKKKARQSKPKSSKN